MDFISLKLFIQFLTLFILFSISTFEIHCVLQSKQSFKFAGEKNCQCIIVKVVSKMSKHATRPRLNAFE